MRFSRSLAVSIVVFVLACQLHALPVRVIATGDMHGWIDPSIVDNQTIGGSAEMLAYWKKVEHYKPDDFLVLSCGDIATGPAISTVNQGDPVIDVMNLMGYDATSLGNHEFDFGIERIKQWEKNAKFPFLSANVLSEGKTCSDIAIPYVIVNQNGVKVALVGLITTEMREWSTSHGYDFKEYSETIKRVVPEARKAGAEVVIVVAHVPQNELVALAQEVKDLHIPLMLGGHSHELDQQKIDQTWVVNSDQWWDAYSRIDLDYDPKTKETVVLSAKQVWLQQTKPRVDRSVEAARKHWRDKLNQEYGRQIGYTCTGMDVPRLYSFVGRCWLAFDQSADVALTNEGSLRQDMTPGPVSKAVIISIMPFNDSIYKVRITGEDLVNFLPGNQGAGLQKIGDNYILEHAGKPIDPKSVYTVLVNNYMYNHSDLLKKADTNPTVIADDWREPVYKWLAVNPTSKEKPIEAVLEGK